jgi:putative addiction module killer protein
MKYELRSTDRFEKWLVKLKDATAKKRLLARLDMVGNGHFGDHKQLEANLFELRLFYGPGYRVYYTISGSDIVFLLAGGDKSSQEQDIAKAKAILHDLEE